MSETVGYTFLGPPVFLSAPPMLQRSPDNVFIPCVLENNDYQAFLSWIAAGNTAPEGWTGPTNPS